MTAESGVSRVPGAGWDASAKGGGLKVFSGAFSRRDGGEVDEGGDDVDGACVRARGSDIGRDAARRFGVKRRRDGHGQCRRAPSFSERPRFRVVLLLLRVKQ